MKCIFCLQEKPPGNEHVFPQSIGGNLRIKNVCGSDVSGVRSCNSILGSHVDAPLVNHPFLKIPRERLKLASYSGRIPNSIQALLKTGTLASDPAEKIGMRENSKTGRIEPYYMRNTRVVRSDTKIDYRIIVDPRQSAEQMKKSLTQEIQKLEARYSLSIIPDSSIIDKIVGECLSEGFREESLLVNYSLKIDITKFRLGVFKIAYELACYWLGDLYLADPTAQKLRSVILDGADPEKLEIKGTVDFNAAIPPLQMWKSDADSHLAYGFVVDGKFCICVKLFDVIGAVILVSESADLYAKNNMDEHGLTRFIDINVRTGVKRETSFAEECKRLASSSQQE